MNIKTKKDARELFGSYRALAKALGLKDQTIYEWPENLTERQINEITGALFRRNQQIEKDIKGE